MNNQPLTAKRRAAIVRFVVLQQYAQGNGTAEWVINETLNAEKKEADVLYNWLERHGYTWNATAKKWRLKK